MAAHAYAFVDAGMPYNKRVKSVHRTQIETPGGALRLTIPVSHRYATAVDAGVSPYESVPDAPLLWRHFALSTHGEWWRTMRGTFETYYGAAPYFDYYHEYIEALLDEAYAGRSIVEYNALVDSAIRRAFGVNTLVSAAVPSQSALDQFRVTDLRRHSFDGPSVLHHLFTKGPTLPTAEI